jgi:RNA polymerase sigma-32 factor
MTLHGAIAAADPNSEERVMMFELHEHLARASEEFRSKLTPRERRIFDARILAEDVVVGRALGEELGCSRQRIEQLETPLREKFFAHVRKKIS